MPIKSVLVAGDICLDVVGIPVPPLSSAKKAADNWRLTGETRTHFLLGGALLVADWVRAALPNECKVVGPGPLMPEALSCGKKSDKSLAPEEFLQIAGRLTRDEIVHSLLSLDYFPAKPGDKKSDAVRVREKHGFSGPELGEDPSLKLSRAEETGGPPDLIVLDDTGNRFRRTPEHWPSAIQKNNEDANTVIVYKLHRPLPGFSAVSEATSKNALWEAVDNSHRLQRLVIISIDDLRDRDVPISRGLSWERTALDLVWQLLNVEELAVLRECPHLIVRMGLDAALYWYHWRGEQPHYHAWLIYDPTSIEGAGESTLEGQMVGYGSAFTAALVQQLAKGDADRCLIPVKDDKGNISPSSHIENGIKAGLEASRLLLQKGFGTRNHGDPNYPKDTLFENLDLNSVFDCQPVPIIPQSAVPDRGYWRLLDSIFKGATSLLHRAVALTATGAKAEEPDDLKAEALIRQVPLAVFEDLRTYDRREIENYRALYALMLDYIRQPTPERPLSVAVFGPPGAGKSFGVKQVAKALSKLGGTRPIKSLTFNLSQYQSADQLSDAFHLVRDLVLEGKIPLVFFDEFDTSLAGVPLGWLRYFLAPMQDAEFLDRGTPHPIGQAIFIFAGGTCESYAEFAAPLLNKAQEGKKHKNLERAYKRFKSAKGPDFLSRLRGTLDVPGLDLQTRFDPFGPVESFPCESAILLRRAGILAHNLGKKAPKLRDARDKLRVSPTVLRALLHLPTFVHGNRSFEALLDMSHLPDANKFTASLLPSAAQTGLHANAEFLSQLLSTGYPFSSDEREKMAETIHYAYCEQSKNESSYEHNELARKKWSELTEDEKRSNLEQADHNVIKLRAAGFWFRKTVPGTEAVTDLQQATEQTIEQLAESEHNRWVAEKRRQGWIAAKDMSRTSRNNDLLVHNCIFPWEKLLDELKELDRGPVRNIPTVFASAGYEVFEP